MHVIYYRSPASAGYVWAMDRQYFKECGQLQDTLATWTGAHIDLAIRVREDCKALKKYIIFYKYFLRRQMGRDFGILISLGMLSN